MGGRLHRALRRAGWVLVIAAASMALLLAAHSIRIRTEVVEEVTSPDGTVTAQVLKRDNGPYTIVVMRSDGTGKKTMMKLSNVVRHNVYWPTVDSLVIEHLEDAWVDTIQSVFATEVDGQRRAVQVRAVVPTGRWHWTM